MTPMKRPAFQQVAGDLVMRRPQMQDSSPSSFVHQSTTPPVSTVVDQGRVSTLTGCVTSTSSCCRSPPRLGLVKGVIGLGADCAATRPMEKMPHAQPVPRSRMAQRFVGAGSSEAPAKTGPFILIGENRD